MVTRESSVLILVMVAVSGQFTAYYQYNRTRAPEQTYNPEPRSYRSSYPYQQIISFQNSSPELQAGSAATTEKPSTTSTDYTGEAEDEVSDCITSTFKTGANYLWDFAKNNATLHCKIGTANLATKFDEYVTKVGAYSSDELEVFLKEARAHIGKSFHRALSTCQDEITRFNYFFEYEVCVPCGFKC